MKSFIFLATVAAIDYHALTHNHLDIPLCAGLLCFNYLAGEVSGAIGMCCFIKKK